MAMEAVTNMTREAMLHYAQGVLTRNAFLVNEVPYYRGELPGRLPHGIPCEIWQQVARETGFELASMERSLDQRHCWLKDSDDMPAVARFK